MENELLLARIKRIADKKYIEPKLKQIFIDRMYNELKEPEPEVEESQPEIVEESQPEIVETVEEVVEKQEEVSDLEVEEDSQTETSDEELETEPEQEKKLKFSELFGEPFLYKIEFGDKVIKFGRKNKLSYYDLLKSFSKRRSQSKCNKLKPTNTTNIYDWKYWEQARYDFNFDNFQDSIEHLISQTIINYNIY